jgi:CRP-like cAMP-binding protein
MVGVPVIMGGRPSMGDAVVRTEGRGFRLASEWLLREFQSRPAVMHLLLRYAHALMAHTAQSAACHRHHVLDQRLCRCLLSSLDSANGATLNLTHEGLAGILGVRRAGVTDAAVKLQRAGLITYARGRVEVRDRMALEAQSCECYRVVKTAYERVTSAAHEIGAEPQHRAAA